MAAQADLWGEIVPVVERTPVSIVREQATLLGTKTKNVVEAQVTTASPAGGDQLVYYLDLVAPSLGGYRYRLLGISYKVIELYPVTVLQPKRQELATEGDFIEWLGGVLSSSETKRVIGSLLAQSSQ